MFCYLISRSEGRERASTKKQSLGKTGREFACPPSSDVKRGSAFPFEMSFAVTKHMRNHLLSFSSIVVLVALVDLASVSAQEENDQRSPAAVLQYDIEMPQHERLLRTRTAEDAVLAPFISDGCSGGLSSGWAFFSSTFPALAEIHGSHPPWEDCCLAHDRLYHEGGSSAASAKQSFEARLAADNELHLCVIKTAALRRAELARSYGLAGRQVEQLYIAIADVIYKAVRLGGAPCSGLPWRWGFGWAHCSR
jgi:hypothetical protein